MHEIIENVKWRKGKPPEQKSVFAKFKGTDIWNNSMFESASHIVLVTVECDDGYRFVNVARTFDGKWDAWNYTGKKVIAWAPLPEPYKGDRR